MATPLDRLLDAERELTAQRDSYLKSWGWNLTCRHFSVWLWELPHGSGYIAVNAEVAVQITRMSLDTIGCTGDDED